MKKIILSSFLLLSVLCFMIIVNTTNEAGITQQSGDKPFLLGAMDNRYDFDYIYISDTDYFGMNLWHRYINEKYDSVMGRKVPTGWDYNFGNGPHLDNLNAHINDYKNVVTGVLGENAENEMITLMHRPKIDWLCYGQRSDYQCEKKQYVNPYLWFYSFQENVGQSKRDNSQYGDGQYVLHCSQNIIPDGGQSYMSEGSVLSRLRCNNQQTKNEKGWKYDKESLWYVKPSIRIDSNVAHNLQNPNVCKIKVIASDGQTVLKEVIIRANDFLDGNDEYNGRYLEEFYFPIGTNLTIDSAWGDAGAWDSRGNGTCGNEADIQVYWYGNCDMWIDYIRVDNDVAHRLLKGNDPQFEQWLEWEADDIGGHTYGGFHSPYRFYIEELEFNNVPCIEYVNKKLQYHSSPDTVDMMVCFYWANFTNHLPYDHAVTNGYWKENVKFDAETLHEVFMDTIGLREFYTETCLKFIGNPTYEKNL